MILRGLTVAVFLWTVACGSTVELKLDASARDSATDAIDSSVDDDSRDAGKIACGDAECDPSQLCLYPACGCVAGEGPCTTPPSCVSEESLGTGASVNCYAGDAGCSNVITPVPRACGRVCQWSCA